MSDEVKAFFKTPRGKAVIKLSLYFFFFLAIAIYVRVVPNKSSNVIEIKTPLEQYSEMSNYEYEYKYNDIMYTGKVYRNKNYFTLNNTDYYVDSKIFEVSEDMNFLETELDKTYYLTNHDIYNYIKEGTLVGKSEDYENKIDSVKYSYNDIYITTFERDNTIFKIKYESSDVVIEIEYMNVGKVTSPV